MKHKIKKIKKDSIAEELNIKPGDYLVKVNDKEVKDILEYIFMISVGYIELLIQKPNEELVLYEIEKGFDEKIGLEFENPILDKPKKCKNNCVFCFVDQLPNNMRNSLYFKDDDFRLGFLHGNYITLTNLTDKEIDRIIKLKISPLNISIHATDSDVRHKMLKNPNSKNLLKNLKKLVKADIVINGQVVLCPGINDGEVLNNTIKNIFDLGSNFKSLAIVPVGLTKYRKGLENLETVSKQKARKVIGKVEKFQNEFLKKRNTRFVFVSDEFYIKANLDLPDYKHYENFIQIENGVGLIAKFNHEIKTALKEFEESLFEGKITIITGQSAYKNMLYIKKLIEKKYDNIILDIVKIKNDFWGHSITVTGLITGQDILSQLDKSTIGDKLFVSEVMLKDGKNKFLDDILISDLEKEFKKEVTITKVNGFDFIKKIIGEI
ncbi:MAG: DUF512 domain-containing protein [Bacillota bacterium]